MNCQNHPESPATAYCRTCGKPVCEECRRDAFGTVYCAEHAPAAGTASGASSPCPGFAPPPGRAIAAPPPGFAAAAVSRAIHVFAGAGVFPGFDSRRGRHL